MASFSDMAKDYEHAKFMKEWAPAERELPSLTVENLRWNIARARAAEAEVARLKRGLREFRELLNG